MDEYIDKSALYEKIAQIEELARNRYLETPSNSPRHLRYMAQLNERTAFKHFIADFPPADVAPVRHARWVKIYENGEPKVEQHQVGVFCSKCMNMPKDRFTESDYCPNCGAKMDGGKE